MRSYRREPDQIRQHASLFWPRELFGASQNDTAQLISLLLETQETFLDVLSLSEKTYDSWLRILEETSLPANLFLKHLMILTDIGGEILKRLTPLKVSEICFLWNGTQQNYTFQRINKDKASNNSLYIKTDQLLQDRPLTNAVKERIVDVAMLLMFGGLAQNIDLPKDIQDRCAAGLLLGNRSEIKRFICHRYILVSPILKGASANALGYEAQRYVQDFLQRELGAGWDFTQKQIPGITQTADGREMAFDIVAQSPRGRYFAIEVSFQVTTNSVIERKAGQAKSRYEVLHQQGHMIAYVIDGAGNFERKQALKTICDYSDCTVALSPDELKLLVQFLREHGGV